MCLRWLYHKVKITTSVVLNLGHRDRERRFTHEMKRHKGVVAMPETLQQAIPCYRVGGINVDIALNDVITMPSWLTFDVCNKWTDLLLRMTAGHITPMVKKNYHNKAWAKCTELIETAGSCNQITLKFVRKGPIDNTSALVLVVAWR